MIAAPQDTSGPLVDVDIVHVGFRASDLQRIEIHLNEGQHDMAVLTMVGIGVPLMKTMQERPVRVSLSSRASGAPVEFFGYVTEVDAESDEWRVRVNENPTRDVKVVCLGASRVMKNENVRNFSSAYIANVVRDIVHPYRMDVRFDDPPTALFPQLVQSGESDWAFLASLVDMIGYRMRANGMNLHIWNPKEVSNAAEVTLRGRRASLQLSAAPVPGTILKFRTISGAMTRFGDGRTREAQVLTNAGTVVSLVSPNVSTLSGSPSVPELRGHVDAVATSAALGQLVADAAVRRSAWPHRAVATCVGLPEARPGAVVAVDSYAPEHDGLWYVLSVRHDAMNQQFVSRIELARDGDASTPRALPTKRPGPRPATVLVNDRWVAQYQGSLT